MTTEQLPFGFEPSSSMDEADYLVTTSNREAHSLVRSWPDWPHHMMALVGPDGSGKTHLASIWLQLSRARTPVPGEERECTWRKGACFLIDDAEAFASAENGETTLFHLFNWCKETGGHVLLTTRKEPNRWNVSLPDLRSRLATVPVTQLKQPDDVLMHVLLAKLFADRQLRVDIDVISYILPRLERCYEAILEFVKRLDERSMATRRRITKPLARQVLQSMESDKEL